MRNLFKRTVRTAFRMELVDLALQAVDGTKVRANAANDRTYDGEALRRLLERSDRAVCALEAQNEAGEDAPPANLPPELAGKKALPQRQAQETLEGSDRLKVPDRSGCRDDEDESGHHAGLQRPGGGLSGGG